MRLSSLLGALPASLAPLEWIRSNPSDDPAIRGIRYDSREVSPGDLFVALRGAHSDGHAFVGRAVELGAAALLVETLPDASVRRGVPVVRVADARRAMAPIAAHFFGHPASALRLVGVTGTNGKTSTTYLVESILAAAGQRVGLIGTVEIRYAGHRQSSVNTTPESLDLQRMLRAMCNEQIDAAVMEVSSHGLELGRVDGCSFQVAGFTNLTQDHLDFHGSMDAYFAAKARLFRDYLAPGGCAVVNVDDPWAEKLCGIVRDAGAELIRVARGTRAAAELRLVSSDVSLAGTRAVLEDAAGRFEVALPLLGDFNLENLLVAAGIARALGLDGAAIAAGAAACRQVPGRMERVTGRGGAEPTVLVDYAHTPDAVEKVLRTVKPLCRGRLVAVFGCGGDRDRTKRPRMAEAVAANADVAIATSDNPRTEDPVAILADVEAGLRSLEKVPADAVFSARPGGRPCYATIVDRREAIRVAIGRAAPEDTIVLAGKGHEDYQIVGREKLPFDDRIEARRALLARREA
ncbi:MAG: UDP-N-acetylmuramoyl-L-alanyl-D-glutamate--2,6-diaminopimelate ligase [Myxococcota bacterium]